MFKNVATIINNCMNKVDRLMNKYAQVNEVNWQNMKNAAKTAGGHALDIATGGISTAVTDTVAAARGQDTGSQVDALQSQVDQQSQDAEQQAGVEADTDAAQAAGIQSAQTKADQLDQTQEQEIDINIQKIANVDQRVGKVEQLIQQVQQQLSQVQQAGASKAQPANPQQPVASQQPAAPQKTV
jgi:hypothetical protein